MPSVETFTPRYSKALPIKYEKSSIRKDDRALVQFRPIYIKTGIISQASGSAYLEFQNCKIVAAVYGPRQTSKMEFSERGKLNCEFKHMSFACEKRRNYQQDKEEKEFSTLMDQALEVSVMLDKYPKSVVDIFVTIIQADGSVLSSAITCASMALADAGVEMFDLVASCTVATVSGQVVLDPTSAEEVQQTSSITIAYMPSLNEVTQLVQSGVLEHSNAKEAMDLCIDGCSKLYTIMRENLIHSAKQSKHTSSSNT